MIHLGSRRHLEFSDIPDLPKSLQCEAVAASVKAKWIRQLERQKNPSLLRAVYTAFPKENLITILSAIVFVLTSCILPFLIKRLLYYIVDDDEDNHRGKEVAYGLGLVVLIGGASLLNIIALNTAFYYMIKFAISTRSALLSLIFQKSVKLSNASRNTLGIGEIITRMSVDAERVLGALTYWLWLFLGPLLFVVAMIMLVVEVGYAGLCSGCVLIIWMGLQDYLCTYCKHYNTLVLYIEFCANAICSQLV